MADITRRLGNRPFKNKKTYDDFYYLIKTKRYENAAKSWFSTPRTNWNNNTLRGRISNINGGYTWRQFEIVRNKRKQKMSNFMNDKIASKIVNFINSLNNATKRGNYQRRKQNLRNKLKNILLLKPSITVENKIKKARPVYYKNLRNGIVLGNSTIGYVKPTTRNVGTQVIPSNKDGYKKAKHIRTTLF